MNQLKHLILAVPFERQRRPVSVPQWPNTEGKLFVQSLNAAEAEAYEAAIRSPSDGKRSSAAEVAALVLVDDRGERVFDSVADAKALSEKDPAPLIRVWEEYNSLVAEMKEKKPPVPPMAGSN